ncbi:AAA family ATPase [Acrocarpospora corrugata]|uniref:AAA family ATPase n=1 Tax=Acrocarpospora corrugata TaxID=35763 RepID=UPI003BEF4848
MKWTLFTKAGTPLRAVDLFAPSAVPQICTEPTRSASVTSMRAVVASPVFVGRREELVLPILEPVAEPSGHAAQLPELVLGMIERLSGDRPLMFILEDLHWADQSTLGLLAYLVRTLRDVPVLLVGTYRSDEIHRRHPLRPLLSGWERMREVRRLELSRFERDEVAVQLAAILGRAPEARPWTWAAGAGTAARRGREPGVGRAVRGAARARREPSAAGGRRRAGVRLPPRPGQGRRLPRHAPRRTGAVACGVRAGAVGRPRTDRRLKRVGAAGPPLVRRARPARRPSRAARRRASLLRVRPRRRVMASGTGAGDLAPGAGRRRPDRHRPGRSAHRRRGRGLADRLCGSLARAVRAGAGGIRRVRSRRQAGAPDGPLGRDAARPRAAGGERRGAAVSAGSDAARAAGVRPRGAADLAHPQPAARRLRRGRAGHRRTRGRRVRSGPGARRARRRIGHPGQRAGGGRQHRDRHADPGRRAGPGRADRGRGDGDAGQEQLQRPAGDARPAPGGGRHGGPGAGAGPADRHQPHLGGLPGRESRRGHVPARSLAGGGADGRAVVAGRAGRGVRGDPAGAARPDLRTDRAAGGGCPAGRAGQEPGDRLR